LGDIGPGPNQSRDVRPALEDVPFDAVIFLGDLNYRVDLPRLDVELFRELNFPSSAAPFPSSLPYSPITNLDGDGDTGPAEARSDDGGDGDGDVFERSGLVAGRRALDQLQKLLSFDQLERERRLGNAFRGFQEGRITFLPSFKYDKGSARYDTSPKARCPAWTDRVLFAVAGGMPGADDQSTRHPSGCPELKLEDYYSVDARHSDHRPVGAHFSLKLL